MQPAVETASHLLLHPFLLTETSRLIVTDSLNCVLCIRVLLFQHHLFLPGSLRREKVTIISNEVHIVEMKVVIIIYFEVELWSRGG